MQQPTLLHKTGKLTICCLLFFAFSGCKPPPPNSLGEVLPIGNTELTVTSVESDIVEGSHAIAVHVKWKGIEKIEEENDKRSKEAEDARKSQDDSYKGSERIERPIDESSKRMIEMALFRSFFGMAVIKDSKGKTYHSRTDDIMPGYRYNYRRIYGKEYGSVAYSQQMRYAEAVRIEDFVILYRVPPEAVGLTMVFSNPYRHKGQPRKYSVSLGR